MSVIEKFALTVLGQLLAFGAGAGDFALDHGLGGKYNLHLSVGTQVRATDPAVDQYSAMASRAVPGVPTGRLTTMAGGPDLNYEKGRPISTVLKAGFDIDLRKDRWGVFLSGLAWHDWVQGQRAVPYGNYPNQFTPNASLSDQGFSASARFSGAQMREVYWHTGTDWASGVSLQARLGRQLLDWGGAQLTPGGINNAIHPADFAAAVRPGALPIETRLPLGMLHLKLGTGTAWQYEAYWAGETRKSEIPGCGTYFDVSAFTPQGCDFTAVNLTGVTTEQGYYNSGQYIHRNPDIDATGRHLGLSAGYTTQDKATTLKWYALDTSASMPSLRITVNRLAFMPPSPLRGSYANLYVDHLRLYGMSFQSQLDPTARIFGEVTLRPDQVISYNAADLLNAFLVNSGPIALNRGTGLLPVGGTFDAYERFRVHTGTLGASKTTSGILGANQLLLLGEWAFSHVSGLPSTDVVRFGRPTAYGTAGNEGFVTATATSLRAYAALSYARWLDNAVVTPSLSLTMDLNGYAYDGLVVQGRRIVRPAVRVEWAKSRFVEYQYNRFGGGAYNLVADRDFHALVAGVRF